MDKNSNEVSQKIVARAIMLSEITKLGPPANLFDEKGQLLFSKAYKTITTVCEFLISIDLDIYAGEQRDDVLSGVDNMMDYFDDIEKNIAAKSLHERFNRFFHMYTIFCLKVNQIVPFSSIDSLVVGEAERIVAKLSALETSSSTVLNDAMELKSQMETLRDDVNIIVDGARSSAQEVIVTRFGTVYQNLSNRHRINAMWWLGAILILVISLAMLSYYTFEDGLSFIKENPELLKYSATMVIWIGSRLILFSAISIALAIFVKNYNAQRHNQILNKHRQNALSTFETFVKSSGEDPAIKDAILMEVTRTIFSPQATGFSSSESEGESQSKIVEIVKNINGNKD